jgi:hypothetical protein
MGIVIGVGLVAMLGLTGRVALPGGWPWPSLEIGNPFQSDSAPASTSWTAEVATDVLNVRDSASLQADVIAALTQGDRVTVDGGNIDGFVPVSASTSVGPIQGWVAVAYLQPIDGTGWAFDPDHGAAIGSPNADQGSQTPPGGGTGDASEAPATVSEAETVVAPTAIPTATPEPTGEHWIDVNRSTATVTLYVGTTAVAQYSARIGRDPSVDGFYSTAVGTFHVYSMQKGLASTPFVDDVYLSDWVGFDPDRKNGFHSPVRNADGSVRQPQNQTTMGCVRLGDADAQAVFAFAEIGMRVEIHD